MTDYKYFNSVLSKKQIIDIYAHKSQSNSLCLLWNKNAELELITIEREPSVLRDEIKKRLLRTEQEKGGFVIKDFIKERG